MITALAFLAINQTMEIVPTDDIWVYPHAADQTSDEYIRCWGSNGIAVTEPSIGGSGASWTAMKFDISKTPADAEIASAYLVLWVPGDAGYSSEDAKKLPIQIRPLKPEFEEEGYSFAQAKSIMPSIDDKVIFGTGSPVIPGSGEPFSFKTDLLKGPNSFAKAWKEARSTSRKEIAFALTSTMDPEQAGEGGIYKFYSRSAEEKYRPKLVIEFR